MVAVEWEREKIGNLFDFKNGLNKGKEFFGYGTPIINYTDVYNHRGITKANVNGKVSLENNEINRYAVKKGDVFFTRTSETPEEVGISSVLLEDIPNCVFSGFVLRGRPKTDRLLPEYCQYCFSAPQVRNEIISRCTYTTRALTNGKQLSAIDIPVPEKSEQTAIATALSDMDALIDGLRRLITKKKNIRQGAMQELLTRERRLPGFDGEWDNIIFDDCFDFLTNNTLSRAKLNYDSGTVKNIHYGDILVKFPFILDCHTEILPYINDGERLNLSVLRNGDILLADTAEDEIVGKAVELINIGEQRILAGLHTLPCRPKKYDMFASMWLGYYINSDAFHNQILPFVTGIKVASISKTAISKTVVSVPSKEEQAKIVEILYHMDEEISSLEYKLKKYENIKSGMMDKLLTGQIRLV